MSADRKEKSTSKDLGPPSNMKRSEQDGPRRDRETDRKTVCAQKPKEGRVVKQVECCRQAKKGEGRNMAREYSNMEVTRDLQQGRCRGAVSESMTGVSSRQERGENLEEGFFLGGLL